MAAKSGRIAELRLKWQASDRQEWWKVDPFRHSVTASELINELAILSIATDDKRFLKAAQAVEEHRLTDERGAWHPYLSPFGKVSENFMKLSQFPVFPSWLKAV